MISNKKILAGALATSVLVLLGTIYGTDALHPGVQTAFAAPSPSNEIFTAMTTVLAIFVSIANFLTFVIFPIVEVIIQPKFFLELHFANGAIILNIWQVSREIMNVIFAFMLIAGACLTVVTAKKDIISRYAIKFVLGIILVNFSWFFPRVILDVGNVLAATIYKLPDLTGTSCQYYDVNGAIQSPCKFPYDFKFFEEAKAISPNATALGFECPLETVCYRVQALANNTNTAPGILSGLIMNHAKLPDLAKVPNFTGGGAASTDPLDQISLFLMFLTNGVFLIVLTIALFLALLAIMVAFIIRIPILWLTMAFMPFMFVGFVMGDIMGNFNTMKIFKKFVAAAFLPAVVAIPFAVGYIVLNSLAFSAPVTSAQMLLDSTGSLLPGIKNLWVLLWQITTILIIWKGLFMALSIDSTYEEATKGIRSFGGTLGSLVANLPLNIPILPGPKDAAGNPTMTSLGEARGMMQGVSALSRQGKLMDEKALKNLLTGGSGGGAVAAGAQTIKDSGRYSDMQNAVRAKDVRTLVDAMNGLGDDFTKLNIDQKIQALKQAMPDGFKVESDLEQNLRRQLGGGGRAGAQNPTGGGGAPSTP